MEARSSRLTLLVEMGAERPEGQRDLVTLGAAGNRAWKQRGTLGVGMRTRVQVLAPGMRAIPGSRGKVGARKWRKSRSWGFPGAFPLTQPVQAA